MEAESGNTDHTDVDCEIYESPFLQVAVPRNLVSTNGSDEKVPDDPLPTVAIDNHNDDLGRLDRDGARKSPLTKLDVGSESNGTFENESITDFNVTDHDSNHAEFITKNPRNIGARRTLRNQQVSRSDDKPRSPYSPKPELICRELPSERQWDIILSIPPGCNGVEVRHNENVLSAQDGEYRLPSYAGNLSISYWDGAPDTFELFTDKPLIFKFRKNWKGDGRKINSITQGEFIVFAPRDWTRKGDDPVAPTDCPDSNFRAYYFSTSRKDDSDLVSGFEEYVSLPTKSRFTLQGTKVVDDSDECPLFVDTPPKIEVEPSIVAVRVGEEKKDGWLGENFDPREASLAEVLNGRQGRFFVRVFQLGESAMADGGEFRFFSELGAIHLNGKTYRNDVLLTPQSSGYEPATLRFVDAEDATMQPNTTIESHHTTVSADGIVSIDRHADADESTWTLRSDYGSTDVVIRLPRIWWRLVHPDVDAGNWCDRPFNMSRDKFRDNQGADLVIRLPGFARTVHAGFNRTFDQTFWAKRGDDGWGYVAVPLGDFVDHDEIDLALTEDVSFDIQCGDLELTLIQVPADPTPEIVSFTSEPATIKVGEEATLRWVTQHAKSSKIEIEPGVGTVGSSGSRTTSPSQTEIFTLRLTTPGLDDVSQDIVVTVPESSDGATNNDVLYMIDVRAYEERSESYLFKAWQPLCWSGKCQLCRHQSPKDKPSNPPHQTTPSSIYSAMRTCYSTKNFIKPGTSVREAVFRILVANGNEPIRLSEIIARLKKFWGAQYPQKVDSDASLQRVLDSPNPYNIRRSDPTD